MAISLIDIGARSARSCRQRSSRICISASQTVSSAFHLPLRLNAFGVLFLMCAMISLRSRLAQMRLREELAPPPAAPAPARVFATEGAR